MAATQGEGVSARVPLAPAHAGPAALAIAADDPSVLHVLGRLGVVEQRVRGEIRRRRALEGGNADDRFRGLYVSDERVEELLAAGGTWPLATDGEAAAQLLAVEAGADAAAELGADLRLRRLARTWGLAALDVELLLVAAAPGIDARFEPLYGYLNDDVSLRHATVGLALALCGIAPTSSAGRDRLGPEGPLIRSGLVEVGASERPQLTRAVRVADRVVGHLLGEDALDPRVAALCTEQTAVAGATAERLARGLAAGAPLAYVRDRPGGDGAAAAAAALEAVGRAALTLDLDRLAPDADLPQVATAAARDAGLSGAGLVAGPVDGLLDRGAEAVRAFTELGVTVVLVGRVPWDPAWSRRVPVTVETHRITDAEHHRLWQDALGPGAVPALIDDLATAPFRLTARQIDRAARDARHRAATEARPMTVADLQRGIRAQNAAGLERLARRVEPSATWDDLIVPPWVETQLRELPLRWRHRDTVLEDWGLGRAGARGRGVSALFAGNSGTGKTLSAEVIASDLGLDLYLVDLSTVVDKYIGETSKNLERIFDEADRVNGVLLFDEADALFGKRSAVTDAKDRHANVEVAYLLQRMETFDGVAILTTNLAANLDEAFLRRLDAIVDFPAPDEEQRRALWEAKLGTGVPRADDVDVVDLARRFKLSGSEIRNIVVSAAYHAVDRGEPVAMADLLAATVREHRKLGRHLTAADLGEHAHLLGPGR